MPDAAKILVTRPEPDATDSANRLRALGLEPIIAPVLTLKRLPCKLPDIAGLSAIAITSANALRALTQEQRAKLAHLPLFAVGDRTAAAARQAGFTKVTSASGTFTDLVALMTKELPGGTVFYPTTRHATGDLPQALAPGHITVATRHTYEMCRAKALPIPVIEALTANDIAAVMLYSRRTATGFCTLTTTLGPAAKRQLTALCLSENVAAPMIAAHFSRIALADYPSEEAMLALALSFARDQIR